MAVSPVDLRTKLVAGDPEYQKLQQEHSQYESQLEQLSKAPYLSSEDLIRVTKLKKLKLLVKDAMEHRLVDLSHDARTP
jgi:uncharacterized protein YdcH (DUF465 family)